jgi:hypothetical protein
VVSFSDGKEATVGQERLPVRKIREVLRLKAEGFSDPQLAAAIGSARSTAAIS